MKRCCCCILIPGLALVLAAYFSFYFSATAKARTMNQTSAPELAWLQQEFHLNEAEFNRIAQLHRAYRPHCKEMCREIDRKNDEIKSLVGQTNVLTPAIEQKLADAGQIRLECQKMMLAHFLEVSKTMPPEQGRRYLAWVQERTFLPHAGMNGKE